MVWIGLVFFVNFVQLVALQTADEPSRAFLHKAVVPSVAWWFRHASTVAVVSGVLLLMLAGYLLPSLVYGTGVYVPPARACCSGSACVGAARHVDVRAHVHLAQHAGGAGHAPRRRRCQGPGPRARRSYSPGSISCSRCPSCSPWWRRRISTEVAGGRPRRVDDAVAASARARRARPLPGRAAGPARRARATCWRWRHSPASWRACRSLVTREPAMGEIRLQWWRDALAAPDAGARTGNPVADAVRDAMHRCDLPVALLLDVIDAREVDLAAQADAGRRRACARTCGKARARFSPWPRAFCGHEPRRGRAGSRCRLRPAPMASRGSCSACRRPCRAGASCCRNRGWMPQREQSGAAVGRRRRQCRGPACGHVCRSPRSPCHEPATCGEFAASGAGGLPSFGLGRDVFAGAGTAGARRVALPAEIAPLTRVWRIAAAHWLGRI